jgi:hypothetical protein
MGVQYKLIERCYVQISSKITEIQDLRSKNLKLKQSLGEAMDKFEMIFGEKVDLENFAEALQVRTLYCVLIICV